VILLDTHIWFWWVQGDPKLPQGHEASIRAHESQALVVSAISCWEVAKAVAYGRMSLPCPADDWIRQALAYPGLMLLPLSPEIAIESNRLPGSFHRDPADQIIVATARVHDCPLMTLDDRILAYPHVRKAP